MNITAKIIITDTNIITDLNNAGILEKFIELDNVYVSDLVMNDEFNFNTCDEYILKKMKTIGFTSEQMLELEKLQRATNKLSQYDLVNYTPLDEGLDDIYQTQYEASDLEDLGLLKMDVRIVC